MDETGFRGWLNERRWNDQPLGKKGIDNRIRRLRRAERSLEELNFGTSDLDQVIAQGRIEELMLRVREMIRGAPSKVGVPHPMVPQADDPAGQLRNILAVLRLYRQFTDPQANAGTPLEQMRDIFLEKCSDFENFEQRDGIYW